jgi:hypothetical protein
MLDIFSAEQNIRNKNKLVTRGESKITRQEKAESNKKINNGHDARNIPRNTLASAILLHSSSFFVAIKRGENCSLPYLSKTGLPSLVSHRAG